MIHNKQTTKKLKIIKLNNKPLTIFHSKPKIKESRAFFQYNETNYYLDEFVKITETPWKNKTDLQGYIHNIKEPRRRYPTCLRFPTYIEICKDNKHVNFYQITEK